MGCIWIKLSSLIFWKVLYIWILKRFWNGKEWWWIYGNSFEDINHSIVIDIQDVINIWIIEIYRLLFIYFVWDDVSVGRCKQLSEKIARGPGKWWPMLEKAAVFWMPEAAPLKVKSELRPLKSWVTSGQEACFWTEASTGGPVWASF